MSRITLSPKSFLLRCRQAYSTSPRHLQEARPPTAPKQQPPLSQIRNNVDVYTDNVSVRNYRSHQGVPGKIRDCMGEINEIDNLLKEPRRKLKELQKQVNKSQDPKDALIAEMKSIRKEVASLAAKQEALASETHNLAVSLPNLTSTTTPLDGEPKLVRYINYDPDQPLSYSESADHTIIGEKLKLLDFSSSSTTSGWGFYYLLNEAALLEQALIQFALAQAMKRGWAVVSPPSLVYSHMAASCGFQPRDQNDEQQIWQVAQSARDTGKPTRSLAATAEIPLAGLYANKSIPEAELPKKFVGSSRCYRAEAGARGVDTKGLYRVHEFTKVEMFGWTNCPVPDENIPIDSDLTFDSSRLWREMVDIQTGILQSLGLPCRVLQMPSTDLGASAFCKIDIEAMFPSRRKRDGGWGEVTSASNCTDYQSRRLDTRIIDANGSRKKFAHTVNGTAMAIPRVLAAILENGWREEDGCVVIPEVLRAYMGGMQTIGPK
ncbi:seryl-tRNA synthetase [Exophiala aquamarina CBS 119918]|uniref:serine--tRNA ligase n=1 Tax=Exophiala aquamarina CBS 119918 TaxID=1182545 RepID=A0A072PN90_9EURO|nr:seryl-tRNA synthetase [Exophiala aquamarina CBS 119918]KEF60768.1 seryl-tRNA synthetase [Exophiala aquamarina CBS 119918]